MALFETRSDRVFNTVNIFLLSVLVFIMAYPLYFVVIASVSNPDLVSVGKVFFLPKDVSFTGYKLVFEHKDVLIGYRNTVFYAVAGTFINLAVTLPAAYALSRKDFRGNMIFTGIFLVTMFFSGGLIPSYLLITNILHLNNTIWVLLLPGATSMWNIVLARTFFKNSIPDELRESAEIDGCSNVRLFLSIILPLSTAIIAVLALFFAVGHWNSYFMAMIYLSSKAKRLQPLQLVLRDILIQGQVAAEMVLSGAGDMTDRHEFARRVEMMKYALIIVATIPVLIIYPFVQKYFVKGIMVGAVKG